MMITPASEALKMQAAKQKLYRDEIFEKNVVWLENRFNYDLRHLHRDVDCMTIDGYYSEENDGRPNGKNKKSESAEFLELVERIKNAGYHVVKEEKPYSKAFQYTAYLRSPEKKKSLFKRIFG